MRISCLQMDMSLDRAEGNFAYATAMIRQAMAENPDVIVLPETWNTGFCPEKAALLADRDGQQTIAQIGALAKEFHVNIVAGSVSNIRDGKLYNTALIFNRDGNNIASYDKTHLFSPMGEHRTYTAGDHICRFTLDGVNCGVIICYDIRFPELTRSLAVEGLDVLFVVSQWPKVRIPHLETLLRARAIENQMFVACCNTCGTTAEAQFGGNSTIVDPWGQTLVLAGEKEKILTADIDLCILSSIRDSIHVFRDRRPELYRL